MPPIWPLSSQRPRSLLEEIIAREETGQLISSAFENKSLHVQILFDQAGLCDLHIPTDTVYARSVPSDPGLAMCRLKLVDLARELEVKAGRYLAPKATSSMFSHARDRTTLAYGRRASEVKSLLTFQSEKTLLTCLIKDLAEIRLAPQ